MQSERNLELIEIDIRAMTGNGGTIDREFGFYEFFSFLKFNEFYEFFSG